MIAVILFPGVIATLIADHLIVHTKPWGSFRYSLYSFVLGIISYIFLQLVVWPFAFFDSQIDFLPDLAGDLDIWKFAISPTYKFEITEVIAATIISMLGSLLLSAAVNNKLFVKLAQDLKISSKYGDENLYSYYLNAQSIDWVYIRDKENNLTYQGRILAFSENENFQELVLHEVTVFGYADSEEYYSVPTMYITKPFGKFVIEQIPSELMGG